MCDSAEVIVFGRFAFSVASCHIGVWDCQSSESAPPEYSCMHICHLYADGWRDAVAPATASHRRARRRRRASDAEAPDRAVRRVLFGDQFRTHRERRAQHDYTPRRAAAEQEAEEMPLPLRHRTYAKHAAR